MRSVPPLRGTVLLSHGYFNKQVMHPIQSRDVNLAPLRYAIGIVE